MSRNDAGELHTAPKPTTSVWISRDPVWIRDRYGVLCRANLCGVVLQNVWLNGIVCFAIGGLFMMVLLMIAAKYWIAPPMPDAAAVEASKQWVELACNATSDLPKVGSVSAYRCLLTLVWLACRLTSC